jgi:hypothetical protein
MIRIRPALLLFATVLSAPAAAQTLPWAFTIPTGEYEYRWETRVRADGSVERTAVGGYLRLHENGRFAHRRDREGLSWSHSSGSFNPGGNMLYISSLTDPGTTSMQTDTFIVRHPGDRLFLWQNLHNGERVEYELALEGAPAGRTPAPGVVPELYGYVAEMLYYESGAQSPPLGQRSYATSFASAGTRYVWVQLQVEYPVSMQAAQYEVACRIRDGQGQVVHESTVPMQVTRGSAARYPVLGWGGATPGLVPPGTYRVGCSIGGEAMLLEGTFQVT